MNKAELKEYYAEISDKILCDRKQKSAFIKELSSDIDEYLTLYPEADMDKIKAEFGTAEEIASSFINNSDTAKIRKMLNFKKLMLLAVVIALLVYTVFVVISLIDVHTEAHGYMQEGIMMISVLKGGVKL